MSWSEFYLLCFLIGFSLSVISFLAGAVHLHLPFKMHFPWHGGHHSVGTMKGNTHLSWFNATTVMAFLAWFGGTGYILTKKIAPGGGDESADRDLFGLAGRMADLPVHDSFVERQHRRNERMGLPP